MAALSGVSYGHFIAAADSFRPFARNRKRGPVRPPKDQKTAGKAAIVVLLKQKKSGNTGVLPLLSYLNDPGETDDLTRSSITAAW